MADEFDPNDGGTYDVPWMLALANHFSSVEEPSSIKNALTALQPLGIDVDLLEHVVEARRPSMERVLTDHNVHPEMIDRMLATYSYTIQNPPAYAKVSALINDETKRVDRPDLVVGAVKWQKKIDNALAALPATFDFKGVGYRGMRFTFDDLETRFREGDTICWYTLKSVATDREVMKLDDFCGETAGRRTIYIVQNLMGKKIAQFSHFQRESEVLSRALACFRVLSVKRGTYAQGDPFECADIIELLMLTSFHPRSEDDVKALLREIQPLKKFDVLDYYASITKRPLRLYVFGECGEGKSSLINGLRDLRYSVDAETGDEPSGVTKDFRAYVCQPIDGRPLVLIDSPGVGDGTVTPVNLVTKFESYVKMGSADGIIVPVNVTKCRMNLGMQLTQLFLQRGFIGEHKWTHVILVATHNDLATDKHRKNFKEKLVPFFFEAAGEAERLHALCCIGDYSDVRRAITHLPEGSMEYDPIKDDDLAEAFSSIFGLDVGVSRKELNEGRQALNDINVLYEDMLLQAAEGQEQFELARARLEQKVDDAFKAKGSEMSWLIAKGSIGGAGTSLSVAAPIIAAACVHPVFGIGLATAGVLASAGIGTATAVTTASRSIADAKMMVKDLIPSIRPVDGQVPISYKATSPAFRSMIDTVTQWDPHHTRTFTPNVPDKEGLKDMFANLQCRIADFVGTSVDIVSYALLEPSSRFCEQLAQKNGTAFFQLDVEPLLVLMDERESKVKFPLVVSFKNFSLSRVVTTRGRLEKHKVWASGQDTTRCCPWLVRWLSRRPRTLEDGGYEMLPPSRDVSTETHEASITINVWRFKTLCDLATAVNTRRPSGQSQVD